MGITFGLSMVFFRHPRRTTAVKGDLSMVFLSSTLLRSSCG